MLNHFESAATTKKPAGERAMAQAHWLTIRRARRHRGLTRKPRELHKTQLARVLLSSGTGCKDGVMQNLLSPSARITLEARALEP